MSYANMLLYGAVLPSYDDDNDNEDEVDRKKDEVINADDPANKEKIRMLLFG